MIDFGVGFEKNFYDFKKTHINVGIRKVDRAFRRAYRQK
jgi:hypothetical protein